MRLDEEKINKKKRNGKNHKSILFVILLIILLLAIVTIAFSFFSSSQGSTPNSFFTFVAGSKNNSKNSVSTKEIDIVYDRALESRFHKTLPVSDGVVSVGTILKDENMKYQLFVAMFREDGSLVWEYEFGNEGDEWGYDIVEESDGYIIVGTAASQSLGVRGRYDALVMKISRDGNLVWYKTYGSADWDRAYKMTKVKDGYIFVGDNYMKGGDVVENYGEHDFWIVKIDNAGNIVWSKSFGGIRWDRAYGIGYMEEEDIIVVAGSSNSFTNGTRYDGYVVAYNGKGDLVWKTPLVNSQVVWPFDLKIRDKNIFVGGYTVEKAGNNKNYVERAFIAKLNAIGSVEYLRTFGTNVRLHSINILNSEAKEDRMTFAGYKESNDVKQPWYGELTITNGVKDGLVAIERTVNSEYGMFFDTNSSENFVIYSGTSMENGKYKGLLKIMPK